MSHSVAYPFKLYNTASKSVEDFRSLEPGVVRLYACGFTVYDYTHLGHLRKYTMDDILVRTLRALGNEVRFVQNVTDVGHLTSDADTGEDKLEKGARKYGESVWDVARRFEQFFFNSMDQMGNLRPDTSCRATEHIEAQLEMVLELERKGHTYVIDGDGVYFDVSTFPEYGQMAGLSLDDQEAGARVSAEGKRNPQDFALWKFERDGENRAMVWESPWHPRSFPGWHIECSAMAVEYLGPQLDIHTGGIDHIPVHHTNEIAQAEAATGKKPFVKYWVHHNFLKIEGEKMSKSLENFYTIEDIVERGVDPLALRLLFLTAHYRSEMNFTWNNLDGAQKAFAKLQKKVRQLYLKADGPAETLSPAASALRERFWQAITADLGTPEAVAVLWEVLGSELAPDVQLALLLEFDIVLGLQLTKWGRQKPEAIEHEHIDPATLPAEIQRLIEARAAARTSKAFETADEIRDQLLSHGYRVVDGENGQEVSLVAAKK